MAVYVNTNYSALQGQRYLGNVQNQLTTTYQRLSSGMRINSAKDDAAGLQIADRLTSQINGLNQGNRNAQNQLTTTYQRLSSGMRINSAKDDAAGLQIADRLTSQINGLNQGNRNASDGIALAQTIEAGMDEISGMLQKIRTLTVQASNGTNTADDRAALGKEVASLATEINRIATQTTYAGKTVLNGQSKDDSSLFGKAQADGGDKGTGGKTGSMTLQVGSNKGDTITFEVQSVMFSKIAESADLVKAKADGKIFGTDKDTGLITVKFSTAANDNGKESLGAVIELMDKAISVVDGMRADLGAIQNRLESSIRNQSNVAANEADARSRIRDADFAEESANLSQQSIIQQAAASMLMQANTRPQLVAANEADARSRIRDADFAEESANLSQQSIIQQAAASMLMQANTRPQLGLSLLG